MRRRQKLFLKHDGRCAHCGRLTQMHRDGPSFATVDHVVPRAIGGSSRMDNLVLACKACNNRRGMMPVEMFRALLAAAPDTKGPSDRAEYRRLVARRNAELTAHCQGRRAAKERAGFNPKAMGLKDAATATLAEFVVR